MVKCKCGCGSILSPGKTCHGKDREFIHGHNFKKGINPAWKGGRHDNGSGYFKVWTGDGYNYEHRLLAENVLGKPLPKGVEVHHHTKDQIVICEDGAYHKLLHIRTKALEACGHVSWRKCHYCKQWDKPEKLSIISRANGGTEIYHKSCASAYQRERRVKNELNRYYR